jgi:hypothetical protein
MTSCRVCGATTRRNRTMCAACGADLESYRQMNASIGPQRVPVRRYGSVPPPAADLPEFAPPPRRRTGRLLVFLLLGSIGAGALALGLSGLLR